MAFIMVLLTFAALIAYDVIKNHRLAEETAAETAPKKAVTARGYNFAGSREKLEVPQGLYYHQGHTWAKVLSEDTVEIGIDDFAQKFVGEIEEIEIPKAGAKIHQGETAIKIKKGNRTLNLVAPVSGKIVEVNKQVELDPDIINDSPYEDGWVVKVHPTSLKKNLRNLFDSNFARKWMKLVKYAFKNKYASEYAFAMQDGGELAPGFGMTLKDDEWKDAAEEFFKNY